ncbi:MAG: helix-turn-helix domain-containing protein [Bryobacteraceae bacterium]|nr:helix-turn-helix domain-containing protein [Bryobacteraceae bacterium]
MDLSDMLDALETRIGRLLLTNQELANQMKRGKADNLPALGLLFPELETEGNADQNVDEKPVTHLNDETPKRRRTTRARKDLPESPNLPSPDPPEWVTAEVEIDPAAESVPSRPAAHTHPFASLASPQLPASRPAASPFQKTAGSHPFLELTTQISPPAPAPLPAPDVHWSFPINADRPEPQRADNFSMQIQRAGLTTDELADHLRVSRNSIDSWLSGAKPVPHWVPASLAVLSLLKPEKPRQSSHSTVWESPLRKSVSSQSDHRHPFARIEDL